MKKHTLAVICILLFSAIQNVSAQTRPTVNHITVYVVDMNKSADFYEKVMQLERIPEPFHDNKHIWEKIGEHAQLHIVQGATAITPHSVNIHLAFSVPSVDDFMKHLDEMHIKYGNYQGEDKQIAKRPDGVNQIYFQDPDGYWIEVNDDKF